MARSEPQPASLNRPLLNESSAQGIWLSGSEQKMGFGPSGANETLARGCRIDGLLAIALGDALKQGNTSRSVRLSGPPAMARHADGSGTEAATNSGG